VKSDPVFAREMGHGKHILDFKDGLRSNGVVNDKNETTTVRQLLKLLAKKLNYSVLPSIMHSTLPGSIPNGIASRRRISNSEREAGSAFIIKTIIKSEHS